MAVLLALLHHFARVKALKLVLSRRNILWLQTYYGCRRISLSLLPLPNNVHICNCQHLLIRQYPAHTPWVANELLLDVFGKLLRPPE
jgi:hypothetical protein